MSIILYSNGVMLSDSANVIEIGGDFIFTTTSAPKIVVSRCGSVAIGSVGLIFRSDDCIRDLADEIAKTICQDGYLSYNNKLFADYLKELSAEHARSLSLIVMTNFDNIIYSIETTYEEDECKCIMSTIRFGDTFTLGSGSFLALTAINSGLNPNEAVQFAIDKDFFSKGPIVSINQSDLIPYEVNK